MRYAAILHEDGRETRLGAVDIDDKGVIHAEAGAEADRKFERFIEESNAAKIMHIDVPPRPGAPEFTLASAIIPRGDPRFIDALKEQATTYYGIELRPE
jgi:hypothetical protein